MSQSKPVRAFPITMKCRNAQNAVQVLVTYGSRVVAAGATSDPYGQRYKGIWICLDLLKRALSGNYVNFGVFELYGDPALKVPCPFSTPRLPLPCIPVLAVFPVAIRPFRLPGSVRLCILVIVSAAQHMRRHSGCMQQLPLHALN